MPMKEYSTNKTNTNNTECECQKIIGRILSNFDRDRQPDSVTRPDIDYKNALTPASNERGSFDTIAIKRVMTAIERGGQILEVEFIGALS